MKFTQIKNKAAKIFMLFILAAFIIIASTTVTYCGGTYFQAWHSNSCTATQLKFMGIMNQSLLFSPSSETVGAISLGVFLLLIAGSIFVFRLVKRLKLTTTNLLPWKNNFIVMKIFICLIFILFICEISAQTFEEKPAYITFQQLIDELEIIAKELESSEILKQEFNNLENTHRIAGSEINYRNFVRVRLAFEATRDSGLWQIKWTITDNEPNSDAIWNQWQKQNNPQFENEESAQATAVGECDELSALFAFIAQSLGVKKVGLFWPTWNHTVAVWTPVDKDGKPVRVVVPTSQVFINANATLGTIEFDPYKQKTVYDYTRRDVISTYKIPASLAEMMLTQIKKYGGKSSKYLQNRRNRLSKKFGGS